jgi:murein DD-endopeptidase MepM/ murein hydrolase activator NlpD
MMEIKASKSFSLKRIFKKPLTLCILAVLFAVLAGQTHIITDQYGLIEELLAENAELKESLADTKGKIDNIAATQADIKSYQQELDRWFKGTAFNTFKKIGKLLSFRERDKAPAFSIPDGGHADYRLANLEFAAERAKYDVATLFNEAQNIRNFMYSIPSLTPVSGRVSSFFGRRKDPFNGKTKQHRGVDIAGRFGAPVYAPAHGRVVTAKYNPSFGYLVEIKHEHGFKTLFGHLSAIKVKKGQSVKRGQQIANVGNTGWRCFGTHLHYEVHKDNVQVDPSPFMTDAAPGSKAL